MRHSWALAFLAAASAFATTPAREDVGRASSRNFIVAVTRHDKTAPALALQMLRQAERFREEIALQWLGGPLPEGQGRVVINLRVSHDRDEGLTWACDSQDRLCHTIYLVTSPQRALGSTLKHEIAHAVLATHFSHPHRLPSWLEEAIASDYDDASRKSTRQRILLQRLRSADAPSMVELLNAHAFAAEDGRGYAFSCALAEFLLDQGSSRQLLQFGSSGERYGWDVAVRQCYKCQNLAELDRAWRQWLQTEFCLP